MNNVEFLLSVDIVITKLQPVESQQVSIIVLHYVGKFQEMISSAQLFESYGRLIRSGICFRNDSSVLHYIEKNERKFWTADLFWRSVLL